MRRPPGPSPPRRQRTLPGRALALLLPLVLLPGCFEGLACDYGYGSPTATFLWAEPRSLAEAQAAFEETGWTFTRSESQEAGRARLYGTRDGQVRPIAEATVYAWANLEITFRLDSSVPAGPAEENRAQLEPEVAPVLDALVARLGSWEHGRYYGAENCDASVDAPPPPAAHAPSAR